MGMIIGAAVVLLTCAGALGYVSLRGVLPWEVAMAVLTGISAVALLAGFVREGLFDSLVVYLEPGGPIVTVRFIPVAMFSLGIAAALAGASLGIASLLLHWGVRVRPAPTSPVARRVQELRGRLPDVVVEIVQQEFLIPHQVVEELLQRGC